MRAGHSSTSPLRAPLPLSGDTPLGSASRLNTAAVVFIPHSALRTPHSVNYPPQFSIREEQSPPKWPPFRVFRRIVSRKRHAFPDPARTTVQASEGL